MAKKEKALKEKKALKIPESKEHGDFFDLIERDLFEKDFPFGLMRYPWKMMWPWGEDVVPFRSRVPAIDMIDHDDHILIRAEVPGVKGKDLDVSVMDNTITIKGSNRSEEEEKEGDYLRHETRYGEFSRTVGLPVDVNVDKIKAKFKDGVLEIKLPKTRESKRRGVKIEAA